MTAVTAASSSGLTASDPAPASLHRASTSEGWVPPDRTVVRVRGSAGNGFRVERHSGRVDHLPTRSEAFAECGEYHDRLARVRCRVRIRTWYADLGELKRALRLARDQPS